METIEQFETPYQEPLTPASPADAPIGVKVLAILWIIGSILEILCGLMYGALGGKMLSLINSYPTLNLPTSNFTLILIMGALIVSHGVLGFVIGRGLFKSRKWARMAAMAGLVLNIILTLILGVILQTWIFVILPVIISFGLLAYLMTNKVEAVFANDTISTTKTTIIMIILTIFIPILLALTGWYSLQNTKTQITEVGRQISPQSTEDCSTSINDTMRNYCYIRLAIQKNDFSYCDQISGPGSASEKANCFGNEAAVTKNLSACTQAQSSEGTNDTFLCVSAAADNFGRGADSPQECDIFLDIPAEVLVALKEEESARAQGIENFSSNYDEPTLSSMEQSWQNNCIESIERTNKVSS